MGADHTGDELTRVLSKVDIFVLAFGAMIGWGWIIQTGYWIDEGGTTGAILAFAIGSVMVTTVGLIYGELASAMPFVGGEHVYSLRALGPAGSFVCTWAIILGYVSVVIFEAVALPSALAYLVPGFNVLHLWTIAGEPVYATWVLTGGIGAVVMTMLNYRGVRPAAQFQTILTLIIGLAGVTLVIGAIFNGHSTATPSFTDAGWSGLFTVVVMTPFMFVGFDVIPQAAGEADVSYRSLGRLIVLSVVMAAVFYIAVIWASGQSLSGSTLVDSSLPAAAALTSLFNSTVIGRIMALAGIAGILTSWNSFIIGGSRAMYALAEADMLPSRLATLHPQHGTPSAAIALIGGISVLAPLFGEQMLVWIVDAGSFGIVLAWFFVVISFLVLRYREPKLERPFKLPGGYAIGVLGLVLTAFFVGLYLPGAPSALAWPFEWLIVFAWCVLGVLFYHFSSGSSEDVTMEDAKDAFESFEN
ncbi:amino acid permease [Haladaptatus sp. R4]|uniref:APC family permease n=1 Tax=Haladaptatus sp. R4 TaxID=1679489 RepID=UPI0007B4D0A0|nr:APC family permease [Haladaptatus sp. R4]KZN23327.1 amino acid permease [Haladaptatus sp. R4]